MQLILLWLLFGVFLSIAQVMFMPPISTIRGAVPRRLYLLLASVATAPHAALLYLTMGFMEWMDTADVGAGLKEVGDNFSGHIDGFLEAWHGR